MRDTAQEMAAWRARLQQILDEEARCPFCAREALAAEDSLDPRVCWVHQERRRTAALADPRTFTPR